MKLKQAGGPVGRFVGNLAGTLLGPSGLVLCGRVLQNVNGFLLSIFIVHRFGLTGAGTLAIATTAIVALALLGTFGFRYTLARLDMPIERKNALGFAACLAVIPASVPLVAVLGLVAGRNAGEAAVIALLALGGPFFAQNNITNALQVLQGRLADCVIPPLGNLVGLLVAASLAPSFLWFAIVLAVFRSLAILLVFWRLPREKLSFPDFLHHARDSIRYLAADAMNILTDQFTVLLASYLMTRGDLGLFGLCRQMLTVSDTPGWSQMEVSYPAMVADPDGETPRFRRRMLRLGVLCGAGVAAVTIPLSLFVYHLPGLMVLGPLLLAGTPVRYLLCVYDLRLRAIGALAWANRVSTLRCVMALVIVPGGAWLGGVTGAILGSLLNVALATWVTGLVPARSHRESTGGNTGGLLVSG